MMHPMYKSFFHFQHGILGTLWRWGIANVGLGAFLSISRRPFVRQFGLQALVWGAIDAALAFFGRRGALDKISVGNQDEAPAARRFRLILLANALADIGYMVFGSRMARRNPQDPARRGVGYGIALQGLFLFLFDTYAAWKSGRWTRV